MGILIIILRIAQLVACITGFVYRKKLKKTIFSFFPAYLTFIVCAEAAGWYLKNAELYRANQVWYNYVVIPIEFVFFFSIFLLSDKNKKWLPGFALTVYISCWLTDMIYVDNGSFWFYSLSYTTGNLLLLLLIFRFYYSLITSDDILRFRNNVLFWISTGLLLFYLGSFPYYGLFNILVTGYPELFFQYRNVVLILNILMYLMFTFSFIWGKPNTKYSSS